MSSGRLQQQFIRLWQCCDGKSQETTLNELAEMLSCSRRHMRTLLNMMESRGWLTWEAEAGRGKRSRLTFLYTGLALQQQRAEDLLEQDRIDQLVQLVGDKAAVRQLLTNRMMLGVFFGQYFLNTITWFFLTWFPIYLVQDKGMSILKVGFVASIPALFGFAGGVLGGLFSDYLIGRGCTLTFARKLPIVLGMLLASSIILCNYTASTPLVITLMALAFFGKGFGALGWPVISDVAPKEIVGLCGGVFNVFGNVASIATPLVIGYIVSELHSFNGALIFVGGSALMMMVCYLFVVGDIKRMELQK